MKFAQNGEEPLVSVCIITYNHEKWISAAIDSVLMQETDFLCELIIADDCSTDKTREIILSYAEKFPVKLIFQKKNKGAAENWIELMEAPIGKYVAYFEGDDSWVDPLKLKKQVKVLNENTDVVLCYSNAKINDTKNPASSIYFTPANKPAERINKYAVIKHCVVPTCTIVFRNNLITFPDWFVQARAGDYFLLYLLSKHGDMFYYDEALALYNHHYNGLSRKTNLSQALYNDALLNYNLIEFFHGDKNIVKIVIDKNIEAINNLFHRREYKSAIKLFWRLPLFYFTGKPGTYATLSKLFIKVHFLLFLSKNEKRTVY